MDTTKKILIGIIIILSGALLFSIANIFNQKAEDIHGLSGITVEQGDAEQWFDQNKVIGHYSVDEVKEQIEEIGDEDLTKSIEEITIDEDNLELAEYSKLKNVWKHTSHAFGFISVGVATDNKVKIQDAHTIKPELTLKGKKVRVTLDRLFVKDYPGKGEHSILMDFYAKNQLKQQEEHVHFNQLYRVREDEQAGISGYPIFVGLNVGNEGVEFKCYTVNVENKNDKKLVGFLEGDLFKSGLKLLNTVNPVTPVLSNFSKGFTDAIENRNKNIAVQDIFLGLDFSNSLTRAKMSQGSYIAIQVPDAALWDWSKWVYNPKNGQIVSTTDNDVSPPFNYFVFSITEMK